MRMADMATIPPARLRQPPAPSTDSDPAADPRRLALEEWEAIQSLCESLARAGTAQGRSLLPLARRPLGEILL